MSGIVLFVLRILLAASLYAFLGLVLYLLWQDLKRQTTLISQKQPPPLTLFYQLQEDSKAYHFSVPEITIGRDPSCDCILSDSTVSAQHAHLTFRQGQWWVEDLRSTNGTFLNQEQVFTPLVITSGDELRFGQAVLTISVSEPASETVNGSAPAARQ